jgi:cytochrome c peroxidase
MKHKHLAFRFPAFAATVAVMTVAAVVAGCADGGSEESALAMRTEVGRQIFHDPNLSEPRGTSCASCHSATQGFSGLNGATNGVTRGPGGRAGLRSSMSTAYMSLVPPFEFRRDGDVIRAFGGFRWDGGGGPSLAAQSRNPFLVPPLMNLPDTTALMTRIAQSDYAGLFRAAYGDAVVSDPAQAFEKAGEAMAAFQLSAQKQPYSSKFDAVVRGQATLDAAQARGLALFREPAKGNCAACHTVRPDSGNPADSPFANFGFYALGVPRNAAIASNASATFFDLGLCGPIRTRPVVPAAFSTELSSDALCGQFRVTSLRNVAERPSYMHNGFFTSLREVVRFYATRDSQPAAWWGAAGTPNDLPSQYQANLERRIAPLNRTPAQGDALTDAEIDDIVAFLRTLSDGYTGR